jgi:outer membrane protein
MKNGLMIWNVLLTLIVGYLLVAQFTGKKENSASYSRKGNDTLTMNKQFRIAYFEMDSIEAHFGLVKDVKAELSKKEEEITLELDRMGKNLQKKYNDYQAQAQSGNMTQAQSEEAAQELKNLDDQMKNKKAERDQEYSDLVMRKMRDVKTKIEDFLKEYNKTRDFSYIVSYEQGLFYYRDSAYNITGDVIRGLNEKYKSTASPSKKQ